MDRFHEGLIDVLTRCRNVNKGNRESKAISYSNRINKTKLIHDFINGKN